MLSGPLRLVWPAALCVVASCRAGEPKPMQGQRHATSEAGVEDSILFRDRCTEADSVGGCALYAVSLIELIARPERFDGKRVRVLGFVNFEFEGNALYLSRADWERGMTKNGVWIEPPDIPPSIKGRPRWNRRDVVVEATFTAANRGHMGLWSGALTHVTRLDAWSGGPPRPDERPPAGQ